MSQSYQPLADRIRPKALSEFIGQNHLFAQDKPLRIAIENDQLHSMIFWGPPGTGKTTLAKLIAEKTDANFLSISAVLSGVKEIRSAVEAAKSHETAFGQASILFVDEVHRFNKSQQDAFLPHIEDGTIIFIGATTENPSFELNNALLSRARTYVLKQLTVDDLVEMLDRALGLEAESRQCDITVSDEHKQWLAKAADGDGRRLLNLCEMALDLSSAEEGVINITEETVSNLLSGAQRQFDKGGEAFYDQISALHKSVRGSNPDGALYWFCRMIDGGCDPIYIARRVVRMASEDIGNADPRGVQIALTAWEVQERLGSPEGELAIAQAILYLASAAKSNAVYKAYNQAMADAKTYGSFPVPIHLRNAPTKLMKELGYGKAYRYAHDEPGAYAAGENYFPEEMPAKSYYQPVNRGLEIKIAEKLAQLKKRDKEC